MCRATKCRTCGKTTWAGCGQHVSSVRASVPASQWCNGTHTRGEVQAAQSKQGGFFSRLFGRRPTMATTELTSDTFRTAPIARAGQVAVDDVRRQIAASKTAA